MKTPNFNLPSGRNDQSSGLVRSLGITYGERKFIKSNLRVFTPESKIHAGFRSELAINSRSVRSHIAAIRAWDRAKGKEVAK